VHGSHASPSASLSAFDCDGLATALQLSIASQTVSPSVSGKPVSAGHATLDPVHVSTTSHVPVEDRHTVPEAASASAGHASSTPSQLSATSQTPTAARHCAVLFASGGQLVPVPSQVSARSHTPAAERQTVPALPAGWPHPSLAPSH